MTYASTVLADSPLAYWRLDDASGTTMADSSGNGHAGTYNGNTTLGAAGLLTGDTDKAISSTYTAATVSQASWMEVNTLTAEAWIKPTGVSGIQEIICRDYNGGGGTASQWRIRLNGNKVEGLLWHPSLTSLLGTTTLVAGTIYHLVLTYDGATMRLYVNGNLDNSVAATGPVTSPGQPITLGALGSNQEGFTGILDEMAFYGTALSATRVKAHYTAGTTAPAAPSGTLAAVAPRAATSLAATYTDPPTTGSLGVTLPKQQASLAASYTATVTGTLSISLPVQQTAFAASYTGPVYEADFAATLPVAKFDIEAVFANAEGTFAASLPVAKANIAAIFTKPKYNATLSATLFAPDSVIQAAFIERDGGLLSIRLPKPVSNLGASYRVPQSYGTVVFEPNTFAQTDHSNESIGVLVSNRVVLPLTGPEVFKLVQQNTVETIAWRADDDRIGAVVTSDYAMFTVTV